MNDREEPIIDETLDAYLDGQLDDRARRAFEDRLRHDVALRRQVELQRSIDDALRRTFPDAQPSQPHLRDVTEALAARRLSPWGSHDAKRMGRRVLGVAVAGVAAAIGWLLLAPYFGGSDAKTPYFQPRPLAQLYREAVDNGFEPYYECREDSRFAETFLRRQGRALRLRPMPEGSRMLGLSYPGGLSRDTTAMLCKVAGQPVMVFVDRLEADVSRANDNDDARLHVFRREALGLVFYEVTPLDAASMTDQFDLSQTD